MAKTWEEKMAKKAHERQAVLNQEAYVQAQREWEDENQITTPPEGFVGWWA